MRPLTRTLVWLVSETRPSPKIFGGGAKVNWKKIGGEGGGGGNIGPVSCLVDMWSRKDRIIAV